jgi:hypothetical protein
MFTQLYEERDENFGNGRDVRNCFEDMIVRQSNRVAAMENPSKEDLVTVLPQDLRDEEETEETDKPAEPQEPEKKAEPEKAQEPKKTRKTKKAED